MFERLRMLRVFLLKEIKFKVKVPLNRRFELLIRGFFSEAEIIYDFDKYGYENYLSDWARLNTKQLNGEYSILLDNKIIFEQVFGKYFTVPANICVISGDKVLTLGDHDISPDYAGVLEYLRDKGNAVFKPLSGGGGHGIIFAGFQDGSLMVNSVKSPPEELLTTIMKNNTDYLMTAFYKPGSFTAGIFPETVNTLRIVTMLDPRDGKAFIASCVQRIGTERSAPTDNCEAGGLSVHVDPNTGKFGRAVIHPRSGEMTWMETHPDTGVRFTGLCIPRWDEMTASVLKTAEKFPYMPYVGWDIILGDEGFCVVEGNSYTGVDLLQTHLPLLADPRIRRFYEYHGILKK